MSGNREQPLISVPQDVRFDDGVTLDSGRAFAPVTVRYETWGSLNRARSNGVLIVHAFSGDAHAAGYHPGGTLAGWWDNMIGPGKAFDTERYFVICSNVLGGCQGTTGPGSADPATGRPYGLSFPVVTVNDMVKVQKRLIDHLGIQRLLSVAGGSMGGMQALEWAVTYPDSIATAVVLASTSRLSAQGIAFDAVGRNAIMSDPLWNSGDYYDRQPPARGLAIARMLGHITYLSDESMGMKFGRKLQERSQFGFDFADQFAVESYLEHQGGKFVDRFDANSYIYLTKAMDYYDISERFGSLQAAFAQGAPRYLVISFTSDWLYPPYQSKEMVFAMMKAGKDVSYAELASPYGHDSFLLETERQAEIIAGFLESAYEEA
ncbi:MAG: homoserine O-acetyltransferase [Spirochaetaceae bacterium]|nr:MAG: homoserine O-acetyltransferase [Spirochaetaceae bacterium]